MRPRSIRARVTTGAVLAFALFMCVILVVSSVLIRDLAREQNIDRADAAAREMAAHVATERYGNTIPVSEPITRMQVVDHESGEVLASSDALRGQAPITDEEPEGDDRRISTPVCGDIAGGGEDECFLVVGYEVPDSAYGDDVTVLAASRTPGFLATNLLDLVLVGAAGLLTVGTGFVIWYGVGRALRPVRSISAEMERISASDLHRRLPDSGTGDEIAELVHTANESLEQLESSVTRQRRFVSDASHELRNPITGMRTKLEVELSDPDPDLRARERLLTGLLSDTERLENIVNDLLELARVETGEPARREPADLAEVVAGEFSDHRRYPALRIHTPEPVPVQVNRLRIVRVLTNLVANAERHMDSRIDVYVRKDGDTAVVEVHDDGSGIPEQDRERVFERFSRLDESKERDPGGSGLGLPISREIVQGHGGTLTAGHSLLLGGAVFTIRLPLAPPEDGT
ncbi:HAMP domain-containing histidine kinase [Nocardiopsis sp. HNM0947]|uniref:histidine kinase n=1 Tax=Nocardiopsis coralli TaxID=2772213 RepID=A0ABR9PBJ8_9ACTN|nr:HAMP domain-containing sensor histidine kinase [Nocardiopsis coralli]MBE3001085.1 HAMP domain-containing histidine kinase [Nocardiopsis coralli]